MLEVLERCFSQQLTTAAWRERLQRLIPSYGQDINADPALLARTRERSDALLGLVAAP